MIDDTNYELLSAYLDDELGADERQRAEQLLSESAECRQVYEELCALRASLASLPRQKLDENIGPRVIRMAEQSMLGKAKAPGAGAERREEVEPVEAAGGAVVPGAAVDRRSRAWRAIIYPVMAVAAAVAMMLHTPEKKAAPERQMARAPAKQAPAATLSAPPGEAGEPESASGAAGAPSDAAAPIVLFDGEGNAGGKVTAGSAGRLTENEKTIRSSESASMAKAKSATILSASPALVAGDSHRKLGLESPQATLVITCKLAPRAVRDKAFDTLLARNHLAPWTAPEIVAKKDAKKAEKPSAGAIGSLNLSRKDADLAQMPIAHESLARRDNAWSKSVVVELDAEQLVAVLADLQNHPDQFLSVELPAQSGKDRGLATRLGLASAEVSAGDDSAADEAEVPESISALETGAPASGPVGRSAGRGGPDRLVVLFRLSAAGN